MRVRSPYLIGRRGELALLREWLADARARQPRLIGGAADYGSGGLPFGAVAEALRPAGYFETVSRLGSGEQTSAGAAEVDPQLRLFEALLGLVEQLAADQPTVLALEDLHWADSSTREFLAFLARNLGAMRSLAATPTSASPSRCSSAQRRPASTSLQRQGQARCGPSRRRGDDRHTAWPGRRRGGLVTDGRPTAQRRSSRPRSASSSPIR